MGRINVLDKHVAELIAAGEVVERPSSVIKELLENSIDANATMITVEIRNGGNTFMRVSDNGVGIAREDVSKAFLRNATSKVHDQNDLDSISTLGFRGEALASIAVVAKVEMLTKQSEDAIGTRYEISAGEEVFCGDYGCTDGTVITVRDLFYNTPARMKFLKKDASESNAVASVVDRIALSYPDIAFKFIRDGKQTLSTPGNGSLKLCIYSIYGKDFLETLIPISYELNGVKVDGYISKPSMSRPTRNMQSFFINSRYVKTKTAMAALEQAYKNSVMVGKFPACVLFVSLPFEAVDVNVHPAKTEVRFMNEKPIFEAVYHGVKSALMSSNESVKMKLTDGKNTEPGEPAPVIMKKENPPVHAENPMQMVMCDVNSGWGMSLAPKLEISIDDNEDDCDPEVFLPSKSITKEVSQQNVAVRDTEASQPVAAPSKAAQLDVMEVAPSNKLIGEAFDTYLIVQRGTDEIAFIDKHATHERMIYEKLKREHVESFAQVLLSPINVTLEKGEFNVIMSNLDVLVKAGFEVEQFGVSNVLVRAAPTYLAPPEVHNAVVEIAGYLMAHNKDIITDKLEWLYHIVACRSAIKGGSPMKRQEMLDFVEELERNPQIKYCPHGRPVSIVLKKRDIEKQFGRIQ